MGACKVLLPLGGRSALEQIAARMRAAGISDIGVVTGGHEIRVKKEALRLSCRVVHNTDYASGMFSSVLAGVRAFPGDIDAFFLLPADTPLIKPATYKALTDVFTRNMDGYDLLYPVFRGKRGHPPLIGRNMIERILDWSGERGLRGLFETCGVRSVDVATADRSTQLDMDTPDDYAALQAYVETEYYPDDEECLELHVMMGVAENVAGHMKVVTECAMTMANTLVSCGIYVNRRLLSSACMLHDIAKGESGHAEKGGDMLRTRGYEEVAAVVGVHMDLPDDVECLEAEILYLADKMAEGDRVLPLEQRMSRMESRFTHEGEALSAARRRILKAVEIQKRVEHITGKPLAEMFEFSGL